MNRFGSTSAPRVTRSLTIKIQTTSCPAAIFQETPGLFHAPAWPIVSDQDRSPASLVLLPTSCQEQGKPSLWVSAHSQRGQSRSRQRLPVTPDPGLPEEEEEGEEEEEQEPRLPAPTPSTAAPTRESGSDSADLLHQSHHRHFNPKYSSTERKGKHRPIMPVSFTRLAQKNQMPDSVSGSFTLSSRVSSSPAEQTRGHLLPFPPGQSNLPSKGDLSTSI